MPVSHLGLTVSHIPSATSFYLSSLQPLGYRYAGQRGDSIGLGTNENADFFLTQQSRGSRIAPTHVAFTADSRAAVRDCYAAALHAGGRPSGAPGYCDDQATAFNAAVEDLDGNTVEFIFQDRPHSGEVGSRGVAELEPAWPSSEDGQIRPRRQSISHRGPHDDMSSLSSRDFRSQPRAQSEVDPSYQPRNATRGPEVPSQGIRRAHTTPTAPTREFSTNALFGTALGAAAGVAVAYVLSKSEQDNARTEEAFHASVRGQSRRKSLDPSYAPPKSMRNPSSLRRNHSYTDSPRSDRYETTRVTRTMRAIKPADHSNTEVEEAVGGRASARRSAATSRSGSRDTREYVSASTSAPTHLSRRITSASSATPTVVPANSYHETRSVKDSPPRSSAPSYHTSRRSGYSQSGLKRRDSGVSMHPPRSRLTARPRSTATATAVRAPRGAPASRHLSAAGVPLPASVAPSYLSAAQIAIPESHDGAAGWTDAELSDDGLGDTKTLVPDDSISCVDTARPRSSGGGGGGARSLRSSAKPRPPRRSEAGSERTARPPKPRNSRGSAAMTLPVRQRSSAAGDGPRRTTYSYA